MADEGNANEGAINFITADFADQLRGLLNRPNAVGVIPNSPAVRPEPPPPDDLGIPFRNDASEDIPAYACMRVTGLDTTSPRRVYTVTKPDTTFGRLYLFNGPVVCKYSGSKRGTAQAMPIIRASYDTGTPANGEGWGPKPSQWTLAKSYPEVALVQGVDASRGFLVAQWHPIDILIGKLAGSLSQGGSATMNVWAGTANSEAVISSLTVTVYDWLMKSGATAIASGKKVVAKNINGNWYVIEAECA